MIGGPQCRRDDWEEVKKRSFKNWSPRWDTFPWGGGYQNLKQQPITSVNISAFRNYCNATTLFDLFGCEGKVMEVEISPRKNKFGRRFGFARFVEVEDDRLLAVRLDNVMVMGKKIYANLPRFERFKVLEEGRFGGMKQKDFRNTRQV